MSTCKYYIQLPNGRDFIEIPAKFGLNPNDELSAAINSIIDFSSELKDKLNKNLPLNAIEEVDKVTLEEAVKSIKKALPKEIKSEFIKEQLLLPGATYDGVINTLNEEASKNGTVQNFAVALQNFFKQKSYGDLENFYKAVSKPITPRAIQGLDFNNVVGRTTLKDKLQELELEKDTLIAAGQDPTMHNLIIDSIFNLSTSPNLEKNNLIEVTTTSTENNSLVIPSTELDSEKNPYGEFLFFRKGDPLSLFLSKFKQAAANIHIENEVIPGVTIEAAIKELLDQYNKSLTPAESEYKVSLRNFNYKQFILGKFSANGKEFEDSSFQVLFNSQKGYQTINSIIDIIGGQFFTGVTKANKEIFKLKRIFSYLNPGVYGKKFNSENKALVATTQEKTALQKEDYNRIVCEKYAKLATPDNRNKNYGIAFNLFEDSETPTGHVAAERLRYNIDMNKDIVNIPIAGLKYGRWIVPTKINDTNNGVVIEGVYYDDTLGKLVLTRTGLINSPEQLNELKIKRFVSEDELVRIEDNKVRREFNKDSESLNIKNKDSQGRDIPMTSEFVINNIAPGNQIELKISKGSLFGVVTAVYPGIVKARMTKADKSIYEHTFTTEKDFKNIVSFTTNNISASDYHDLTAEDYVAFKAYNSSNTSNVGEMAIVGSIVASKKNGKLYHNRVVFTSPKEVFVLVKSSNGVFIEGIQRSDIESVRLRNENEISLQELADVAEFIKIAESNKSKRKETMSSFTNPERAQKGDYAIVTKGETQVVWKILEKLGNTGVFKAQTGAGRVEFLNKVDIKSYATNRVIAQDNDFAIKNAEVNSWKIITNTEYNLLKDKAKYKPLKDNKTPNFVVLVPPGDVNSFWITSLKYPNKGRIVALEEYTKNAARYAEYTDVTEDYLKMYKEKFPNSTGTPMLLIDELDNYKNNTDSILAQTAWDTETKLKYIQQGTYLELKGDKSFYRVMNTFEENGSKYAYVEYNTISEDGKLLSFEKLLNLNTELDEENGQIKNVYFIKGSKVLAEVNKEVLGNLKKVTDVEKNSKKSSTFDKNNTGNFVNFVEKMQKLADKLGLPPIEVSWDGSAFDKPKEQRAKIQNGKVIVNGLDAEKSRVIHEFLHLFMIGAKYDSTYEELLLRFATGEGISLDNINDFENLEELFVDKVAKAMAQDDAFWESSEDADIYEKFKDSILATIENLFEADTSLVSKQMFKNLKDTDLHTLLKTPVYDIIGEKSADWTSVPILEAEPAFRKWLAEKNVKLTCN